jgi:hypothetical protein
MILNKTKRCCLTIFSPTITRDFEDKKHKGKSSTEFTFRDAIMMVECNRFLIYKLRQEAGG